MCGKMDRQSNEQTDAQTDVQADKKTDNRQTNLWTDGLSEVNTTFHAELNIYALYYICILATPLFVEFQHLHKSPIICFM